MGPGHDSVGSIVAADDHHRVVVDARLFDRVEDLTDANVHFADKVGVVSAALDGLSFKRRVGNGEV